MPHPISHSRRVLLGRIVLGAAALPLLRLRPALAADLPHLSPDEAGAKAMHYTPEASTIDPKAEPSYAAGSHCGNCALYHYSQAQGDWATCDVFTSKAVNSHGWCLSHTLG